MGDAERDRFEAHLLVCDYCWTEVQRLDSTIRFLRSDKSLSRSVFASDIVSTTGISGRLHQFVGGHLVHLIVSSLLCGLLFALSVFTEIAYEYDRFARLAWVAAPPVFCSVFVVTAGALAINWFFVRRRRTALVYTTLAFLLGMCLLYAVVRPFLPARPITQATFQTYTAQTAYLKGMLYAVPFAYVLLLLPFNFILTMQRELRAGRHRAGIDTLTGGRYSVAPHGAPYPRFTMLCVLFIIAAIASFIGTSHLLENLLPTAFSNLFIHTIQARWLLYMVLGLECLGWYHFALSDLKRECLTVLHLCRHSD